jgi:exodeoxyribonuclease V gamma subunit
LETLAERLAVDVLASPLGAPFASERIIVQTQGMAQWLKLDLARRQGIAANIAFPFPRAFLFDLMERILPESPRPIAPSALTWRILETLGHLLDRPAFQPLRNYLPESDDARPAFQLSERIANLFDQYSVYRPGFIEDWLNHRESGDPSELWQSGLWREAMTGSLACQGKFLFDLIEALKAAHNVRDLLPERLSIFGATSMPPIYLEVFKVLGRHIPVHLFWLSPCREYWGDCPSPREAQRIRVATGPGNLCPEDLHTDPGHPLLTSWGKAGREFLDLIVDADSTEEIEDYNTPTPGTLLGFLQSGILNLDAGAVSKPGPTPPPAVPCLHDNSGQMLFDLGVGTSPKEMAESRGKSKPEPPESPLSNPEADTASGLAAPHPVSPDDRSVQIHSCHSPLRELQVLRDHLLLWFDADPALSPSDILVMLPEVGTYAPFVKGVFESEEPGAPAIPFSLADEGARQQSPLINGFVTLLRLEGSRLAASSVMALFETSAVRRRFGIAEEDLPRIRQWVRTSGTRWGRNAGHRKQLGLPDFAAHTWEHGRDRLLLGYAMADDTTTAFNDLIPCEGIEGTGVGILGRWLDFQQQLFTVLDALAKPRTLAEWANTLDIALDTLFLPDPAEDGMANALRLIHDELRQDQEASGCRMEIPLPVILERILPQLEQPTPGRAFVRGAVTFAGLKPMRGIPFRIICLLGMQDGSFPRNPTPVTFDLMARKPKPGDASRREDDRYLFLETLLSARDRFYISYVGQSVRDNSPRPPSVVVSELLDFIGMQCRLDRTPPVPPETDSDPGIIDGLLVTRHGLHPFSPKYFPQNDPGDPQAPRQFSFSPSNARISRSLLRRDVESSAPFLRNPCAEPGPEFRTLTVKDLQAFFRNPAKAFVTKRLQFSLPGEKELLEDDEPFAVDKLDEYTLKKTVADLLVEGASMPDLVSLWQGRGLVPPATAGIICANDMIVETSPLVEKVRNRTGGARTAILRVDLSSGGFRVEGRLRVREGVGLVHYRPSNVALKEKPKAHLDLWIEHLAFQLIDWPGPKTSCLIGEDTSFEFAGMVPAGARRILDQLLDVYWQGLIRPLPFFPKTSCAFARQGRDPMKQATQSWEGTGDSDFQQGEKVDPYFHLCFGNDPAPLGDAFQKLALEVFAPMTAHQKERRG